MARPGPLPKPADERVRRNKDDGDWREVENVVFAGKSPDLPGDSWSDFARDWWAKVRRMPHCVLWTESDWLFALETAIIADRFAENPKDYASELRQRGKTLGLTDDDRRRMLIRYVDPQLHAVDATVTVLDDFRNL
jgi:hypothetical protein